MKRAPVTPGFPFVVTSIHIISKKKFHTEYLTLRKILCLKWKLCELINRYAISEKLQVLLWKAKCNYCKSNNFSLFHNYPPLLCLNCFHHTKTICVWLQLIYLDFIQNYICFSIYNFIMRPYTVILILNIMLHISRLSYSDY